MAGADSSTAAEFGSPTRRARMGSIDWCEARQDWQTGPDSLAELYAWTSNAFSCLSEKKPESLVCLRDNVGRGGTIISHYSGKGTAESMLADISEYVCKMSPSLGTCLQPRFRCSSACDISHTCRNLMLQQPEESRPQHIFGNILDRIPQQSPPLTDLTNEQVHDFLRSNGCRLFHTDSEAFCFRHLRPCRIWKHQLLRRQGPGCCSLWLALVALTSLLDAQVSGRVCRARLRRPSIIGSQRCEHYNQTSCCGRTYQASQQR